MPDPERLAALWWFAAGLTASYLLLIAFYLAKPGFREMRLGGKRRKQAFCLELTGTALAGGLLYLFTEGTEAQAAAYGLAAPFLVGGLSALLMALIEGRDVGRAEALKVANDILKELRGQVENLPQADVTKEKIVGRIAIAQGLLAAKAFEREQEVADEDKEKQP